MNGRATKDLTYFPGCSLATSARESNLSLINVSQLLGLNLIELEDWNCCGTSSAHSLDQELAFNLAARNVSLAPAERPIMVMCPGCLHRLLSAHIRLKQDPAIRSAEERRWGRSINPELQIFHFFEILDMIGLINLKKASVRSLKGLKFVPYYGCMLARPPALRWEKNYRGLIEKILSALGAEAVLWPFSARCCGTFLAAARPDIATPLVNRIMSGALKVGAECIITACAMCQLNLEIRCTLERKIPTLHFSEILALALGEKDCEGWFRCHLIDPRPLLRAKHLIS